MSYPGGTHTPMGRRIAADAAGACSTFETIEQRGLYKLAVAFADAVQVAADSLAFLDKFTQFMGPGEREQMAALQGELNQACDFES